PVIDDQTSGTSQLVRDSWAIAEYLETTYPDNPSLFGGDGGLAVTKFIQSWNDSVLVRGMISLFLLDIHDHLTPEDKVYFRTSREARFKRTLEEVQEGREARLKAFQNSLFPLRLLIKDQPFLGGEQPLYADYIIFGCFQWARVTTDFVMLKSDDPVKAWFDRCLDLHDGLGRSALGYSW
ncbi:MAG: glutathione S-transferase family protein, partial [Chloroflexota bacterium]